MDLREFEEAMQGLREKTGYRVQVSVVPFPTHWGEDKQVKYANIPSTDGVDVEEKVIHLSTYQSEMNPTLLMHMINRGVHEYCHIMAATPEEINSPNLGLGDLFGGFDPNIPTEARIVEAEMAAGILSALCLGDITPEDVEESLDDRIEQAEERGSHVSKEAILNRASQHVEFCVWAIPTEYI
jgi:hypothetical protein